MLSDLWISFITFWEDTRKIPTEAEVMWVMWFKVKLSSKLRIHLNSFISIRIRISSLLYVISLSYCSFYSLKWFGQHHDFGSPPTPLRCKFRNKEQRSNHRSISWSYIGRKLWGHMTANHFIEPPTRPLVLSSMLGASDGTPSCTCSLLLFYPCLRKESRIVVIIY